MGRIAVSAQTACTPEQAFALVTDLERMTELIPEIVRIERLTDGSYGLGTRFRETRMMFGREATESFEVIEYDPPRRFVLYTLSCGVEYRSTHHFVVEADRTRIDLVIESRPVSLMARLMTPVSWLMTGFMRKAITQDLKRVTDFLAQGEAR